MSTRIPYPFPAWLGLVVILALALSASGLPITAQQAPTDAQPSSAETGAGFRPSPVMFVENAGQGDKRNASEIVDKNKAEHTPVSPESWNVELIGQVGGPTYAVAVQGNYAYIGVGPRLVILDIADPAHPIPVSQTPVLPDVVKGITVVGNYAYVANASAGFRIVNIANPVAPIEVSFWDTPDIAERVAIAGQYAYVADSSSGLRIIDIRNPMAPVEVGAYDTPGTAIDVVVTNNHAYVADSSSGLRIISVANPSSPSEVGFYAESAVRLVINGNYVYLAAGSRGLRIIGVTNPAQPVEVGAMQSAYSVNAVAIRNHLVYLLEGLSEIRIVDVRNAAAPIGVGNARARDLYDLSLAGDYAFIAGGMSGHGLQVADISSPTSPAFISSHRTFHPGVALAVAEKRAYTVHEDIPPRFRMVDVSQPDRITTVGVCCEDTINFDVAAAGNYAYIASDFNGLRVIDASNPISPVAVGHYGNFYAKDVEVRGRYAYVWGIGFRVFDVSAPNAPKLIGVLSGVSGLPDANRVAVTDDYYYATSWSEGNQLEVINITNPRIPVQVASLRLPYTTKGIAISGNYLFIAAGDNGLRTMDVSNPRTPVEVASLQIPGGAKGVAISGSYLYIGAGANGLRVMDISSPLAPSEVGYYKALQRETTGLVVSEGLIYLPLRDLGLFVLRFGTTPTTYTISGRVTDANGRGIPGVTVWAGFPRATTTDANGNYTFTGLPAGTYTIRPEKDPYVFSPESRTVTVPPDATGVDFQAVAITKIQVNQVLGNTTNYVAGKNTAVRVFLSAAVPFDPDHQQLQIYRDGNLITQTPLKPRKFSGQSDVLDFLCDRQECGSWQKGFYSFEARVNGDYLIQPNVEFKKGGELRILVVPVKTSSGTPRFDWPKIQEFMKSIYPVAASGVRWKPNSAELKAEDLDLSQESGQKELLIRLEKRRRSTCRRRGSTCYDAIVGIIPEMKICNPAGCIPCDQPGGTERCSCTKGWTPQNIDEIKSAVVMEVEEMPTVGVHEVGHLLGLGDEYKGGLFKCDINPPPSSYVGRGGLQCTKPNIPEWTGACGASGSKVRGTDADLDEPFEVFGRGALPDMLSFMGSGEKQAKFWVTPTAYDHLFFRLSLAATYAATAPQVIERVIDVSGWIQLEDTANLDPVYHVEADAPPVVIGPYSIEVLDAQGNILASQGFNVSFAVLTEPPQDADEGPFVATVRFPTGAAKLRVKRGTTILTEAPVSTHVPNVTLTSPTAGQTWAATGNYTIRWQGNDLDGDTLYYTVLYRQGTDDWIVLGADLTTNELTVDAAGLPGGTAAQVQVLATDGINTTTAESGLFTVGRKGPEAFITYPAEGASFMPGVSFFLQGTAYDLEDGALPDSAYRWTSNQDGDLGTGASNLVILSPGPHVITLTVTDSDGNSAVKTIQLSAGSQQFMPLIWRSR